MQAMNLDLANEQIVRSEHPDSDRTPDIRYTS